jgi:DNA adenine methylase
MDELRIKPIIKYAGGKRQVMSQILPLFPTSFGDYHEPFVGSASVLMELWNRNMLTDKKIYISDIMEPLIQLYRAIKQSPEEVSEQLEELACVNESEAYYNHRNRFNVLKESRQDDAELAALFIYLNKSGFNGMYRENSKGVFNVPFGRYKKLSIPTLEQIQALSAFLSDDNVTLECQSFEECERRIKRGDFVYFDPPYYSTFNNYTKHSFTEASQEQLKQICDRLTEQGALVAISNSDHQYIRELYKDYNVHEIMVKRMISCDTSSRHIEKTELLITNYN